MNSLFLKQMNKIGVSQKTNILLAVSGGIDSMVLFDLLLKNNFSFSVAHCNFSLRGCESDEDSTFIKKICDLNSIKFFMKKINTTKYADDNNLSIQMAARKIRYDWFKILREDCNFSFIATAHHCNDSVETLLINLIRGTGISGLRGIKELDQNIIRPLLSFTKNDLIKYTHDNNIQYREDSSNSSNKYVRNKVRNQIIPIMQEINPDIIDSIAKTMSRIEDVEIIYNQYVHRKKKKLLIFSDSEYSVCIDQLLQEPAPKQLLYEIISDFGFKDIDSVFVSLFSNSGKEFYNKDFYMVKDRNQIIITKHISNDSILVFEETSTLSIPFDISFNLIDNIDSFDDLLFSNQEMYINYSNLKFPLLIRPWRAGDSFVPLGMKKFKKLSDYFIDKKFSLVAKKKSRVLVSDSQIVCIIGERLDERFKLVENSKKAYIVKS